MHVTRIIKRLFADGSNVAALTEHDTCELAAAMLDGGVAELELGAALALLERRTVTLTELLGFAAALEARCFRVRPLAATPRPVVFASYHGVREHPNCLPLVALTLQRLGIPVLVHGTLDSGGGVAAAYVFRELGVMPCANLAQAQLQLDERRLAFVPTVVLAPGLAGLLSLRGRLGFGGFMSALARIIAPIDGEALHVVAANSAFSITLLRDFLRFKGLRAVLFEGTEDEAFADPRRRPRLEYVATGESHVLFEAECGALEHRVALPGAVDAHSTADWTRRALAGETPMPLPLVNQVACCLYGAGYTDDLNQAKAIVALETGSLAAA